MKKLFTLLAITLLFNTTLLSQDYKYAWITDTHIGFKGADNDLDSVVQRINASEAAFTIVSGDITELGKNSQLELAKQILDKLEKPYYIIPGNHDTKWTESGGLKFTDLWKDNKFSFKYNNDLFIGVNSGIMLRGGGGHITPEDLRWLDNQVNDHDYDNLYFIVHHPLDKDIDNWYKATNIFSNKFVTAVYCGHGHANRKLDFNGIPGFMARSSLSRDGYSAYTMVESKNDSLFYYEMLGDSISNNWATLKKEKITPKFIDSTQVIADEAEIIWQYNVGYSLQNEPVVYNNNIYYADYSGLLTCIDSTSQIVWDYDLFGNVTAKPSITEGILTITTLQGDLVTINAETGENLQTIGFDETLIGSPVTFEYTGSKPRMLPKPKNLKSVVAFGSSKGKVYCYDIETLERIWINESAQGMIEKQLHVNGENLYFGAWDNNFYCIDSKTGLLIWKWHDKKAPPFYYSPAACQPVSSDKYVYFTTPNKKVHALDLLLGKPIFERTDYKAWESIGLSNRRNRIFIKSMDDKFHIASSRTGNPVKNINLHFGEDTTPTELEEVNGNIIFGARNGTIYLVDNNKFKVKKLLSLGPARVHKVVHVKDNIFLASNMDGIIVMFKI